MAFSRLELALDFALKAHAGGYRDGKDALPYITHPMEVLTLLRYVGGVTDEDLLCVGALHDVVEDCGIEIEAIRQSFGERVAGLVQELTRFEPDVTGMDKEMAYEVRSRILLEEIAAMSDDAKTVKLADRLANLRQARITRSKKKLRRYVRQTSEILQIIPRSLNSCLWDAISQELTLCKARLNAKI